MSKLGDALIEIQEMEREASNENWLTRLHPAAKLVTTILYIILVVSFGKYQLTPLILMSIYPIVLLMMGEYSFALLWKRMKIFFLMALLLGCVNPFFDRSVILQMGAMKITGGVLSMLSLFLKGSLAVSASYLLICSTSMNGICYGMRFLHIPKILVMVIMLLYRYIFVFIEEAEKMMEAYSLRAPGQKGIHYKAWGSMIGQMLLRTIDRADLIFTSMQLRGFQGELLFYPKKKFRKEDWLYTIGLVLIFILIKIMFIG